MASMKEVLSGSKRLLIDLKLALLKRDLRQFELARLVETTPARLSRIVRGHIQPRARERARIARVLGIPSWRLFPGVGRGRLRPKHAKSRKEGLNKGGTR